MKPPSQLQCPLTLLRHCATDDCTYHEKHILGRRVSGVFNVGRRIEGFAELAVYEMDSKDSDGKNSAVHQKRQEIYNLPLYREFLRGLG